MARRVFFLNKLRDGVEPAAYERWLRAEGYPFARGLSSVDSYVVTRLEGLVDGDGAPPYDFLETVEVTDLDAYMAELSPDRPEVQEFDRQWLAYVGEVVAVYGRVVE